MYEITTVVKPILEELGLYNGKDVSAKVVFQKYSNISPNGIRTLWKFQIIVMHELNIYVKSRLFEGHDEIYIFSLDPPQCADLSNAWNWKEVFLSSSQGRVYHIFDDESLVDYWLSVYEELYDEFENPKNKLYLYKHQHKKIALYWLRHGKHDSTSVNTIIIRGQKTWDQFLKNFVHWESKADDNHTVRHWL